MSQRTADATAAGTRTGRTNWAAGAVGFPAAPPLPNLATQSLVGHVVYGVVLGGVYAAFRNR